MTNTFKLKQHGPHLADYIMKMHFPGSMVFHLVSNLLQIVPNGPNWFRKQAVVENTRSIIFTIDALDYWRMHAFQCLQEF